MSRAETKPKAKARGEVFIDRERCKGCLLCIEVCPTESIEVDQSLNQKGYFPARFKTNRQKGEKDCTGCTQCALVCPEVAIEVYRAQ